MLLCVALMTALLVARQIAESQLGNDFYEIIDWRIFYPGHFIRRGLRGTIVGWLSQATHLDPPILIRIASTVLYTILCAIVTVYVFNWLWPKARSWIPLVLFSPVALFFYVNAVMSIERFDVVFLLLTIGHLELSVRIGDRAKYILWATAMFATLGTGCVLCHEAFVLLCVPVNAVLSWRKLGGFDARLILIYGLPVVATVLCAANPVGMADVLTVSAALRVPFEGLLWYASPLCLLGLSLSDDVRFVASLFSLYSVWPILLAIAGFGAIQFAGLARLTSSCTANPDLGWVRADSIWTDFFALPLVYSLPLYVIAADYGRWFAMIATSFLLCCCRLLTVTKPVKRASPTWTLAAMLPYAMFAVPIFLRLPRESSQLPSAFGTELLGHFLGR